MNKELIKQRFKKSLRTYDSNAIVQKMMAEKLVGMLPKIKFESILELGCGSGVLTKELLRQKEFRKYCAVDIVRECGEYISKISERIDFVCSDIEEINLNKEYDLIISNASIQWVSDLKKFIQNTASFLAKDGYFVFTLFSKNNYNELNRFVKTPLIYYSPDEIKELCTGYKIIEIKEDFNVLKFDTPLDVLHHIRNTGVNAISDIHWTKSDLKNFENNYPRTDGLCQLTYNPMYIILTKL